MSLRIGVVGVVLFACAGCGGGGGGGARESAEAQAVIGAAGGAVEVTNPASPLFGVRLEIPPGALAADVDFRVVRPSVPAPTDELESELLSFVELEPSGTTFLVPAVLTLPYADIDSDGYVDTTAQPEISLCAATADTPTSPWEYLDVTAHDPIANRVSISIDHLSLYRLRLVPQLHDTPVEVWVDSAGAPLSPADQATAEATIQGELQSGFWTSQLACLGWDVQPAGSSADAHVVVQWGVVAQPPPSSGQVRLAQTRPPATTGAPFTITLSANITQAPWNMVWHVDAAAPPSGAGIVDLLSVVAHEFAHALGLPPNHLQGVDLENGACSAVLPGASSVCATAIASGARYPGLDPADEAFFVWAYPASFSALVPSESGEAPSQGTVSFHAESTCLGTPLDTSKFSLYVVDAANHRFSYLSPSMSFVTTQADKAVTASVALAGPFAVGTARARAIVGDNCGRLAAMQWEFTVGTPPHASFTGAPLSGQAPLNVAFTDHSTGTITARSWNFGDGVTSTLTNPSHTYTAVGNYTVALTVSGPTGTHTQTRPSYVHVSAPSNCVSVQEGPWEFDLSMSPGDDPFLSYVDGNLNQTGCNLTYDEDNVFHGPLVGSTWSVNASTRGFTFTGHFTGSPPTRHFSGTWTSGGTSGPFVGNYVGP